MAPTARKARAPRRDKHRGKPRRPDRSRGRSLAATLMRIVGGRLRGRALAAPKSQAIRPTADRLRESLFNILMHAYGDPVADARVLDLFAGTGALGLEALSRGAAFVLFVDDGAEARALLRAQCRDARRSAAPPGSSAATRPSSARRIRSSRSRWSFLDPPYGKGLAEQALASARERRLAGAGCADRGRGGGRRRASRRRKASRSSSGATTTTPSSCSCATR